MEKGENAVELIEYIISEAVKRFASDIHFEPYEDCVRIRLRIDGELEIIEKVYRNDYEAILSRIKVLSSLRLDGHGLQDGRMHYEVEGKDIDIRISIIPSFFGESVVMRLFGIICANESLENLGFLDEQIKIIESALDGSGLILITGPTGSGKTTTLYTLLKKLPIDSRSIITLEDPVERTIPGIRQIQVHPRAGITFSAGLRAILRHDPDIIMIGEIRDTDTARIAMHSAMTGHLVLSTIHTTNACGVIPRLIDMGIEPFLISSALKISIAQKLARKVCSFCKVLRKLDEVERENLAKYFDVNVKIIPLEVYSALGCEKCSNRGYKGRRIIGEVLQVTRKIQNAIHNRESSKNIRKFANHQGFHDFSKVVWNRSICENISLEEIISVIEESDSAQ